MKNKKIKQIISIMTVTLALSALVFVPSNAGNKTSSRYEGPNRYSTATAIANKLKHDKFNNVVIAYGYNFPDALSGSVLASKVNAPILLVGNSVNNSTETINYINSNVSKDGTIYLLGGEGVVKNEIVNHLKNLGFNNFKRLGGSDRYETNALINKELNVPKGTPVAIASGLNFPDALSISGAAGTNQMPIYLVGKDIRQDTLDRIREISPSTIYIAGGNSVVSTNVENALRGISNNIVRFDGSDRYDTSLKIANHFSKNADNILVANALNFPDALSGSVLASKINAPVILVPPKGDVSKQKEFVDNNNVQHVIAVGGEDVVSKQVVNDLLYTKTNTEQPQKSLTPQEIEGRLPGLGLSLIRSDYGQSNYKPSSENFVVCVFGNRKLSISLFENSASDAETIKTILNLALPTSGNEVYNIITKPFSSQTITRDGKTIKLNNYGDMYGDMVSLEIFY